MSLISMEIDAFMILAALKGPKSDASNDESPVCINLIAGLSVED